MARRLPKVRQSHADGFTLVELLVATAILMIVLSVAGTVLATAMRSSNYESREQLQRIQLAVTQVGEDMIYARWVNDCSGGPCSLPKIPTSDCYMNQVPTFTVPVYQPFVDEGSIAAGGPPYLKGVGVLDLTYTLTNAGNGTSTLTREIREKDLALVYVRQELVTKLVPCTDPSASTPPHQNDSYLRYDPATGLFEMVLRTKLQTAGSGSSDSKVVEVLGAWSVY